MKEAKDKELMLDKIQKWRKSWKVIQLELQNPKLQLQDNSQIGANLVLEWSRLALTDLVRTLEKKCKKSR